MASGFAAAVTGKPFDWFGQAVYLAVTILDPGDHQAPDVFGGDAVLCRHMSHRLAVKMV